MAVVQTTQNSITMTSDDLLQAIKDYLYKNSVIGQISNPTVVSILQSGYLLNASNTNTQIATGTIILNVILPTP